MSSNRFRKADIRTWHQQLSQLPDTIAIQEKIIEKNNSVVAYVDQQLASIVSTIAPFDKNIAALTAQQTIVVHSQRMAELQAHIATQQKNIPPLESELAAKEAALALAIAETQKIETLLKIKEVQNKQNTLPLSITVQEQEIAALAASIQADMYAISQLNAEIISLSASVESLSLAVIRDQQAHSRYDYHSHSHHGHHHHHGHHRHHGHYDRAHGTGLVDLLVNGVGAVAEVVHAVNDDNRETKLASQRAELASKRLKRDRHQCDLPSRNTNLQLLQQSLASNQLELDSNRRFLNSVSQENLTAAKQRKRDIEALLRDKQNKESVILSECNKLKNSIARCQSEMKKSENQYASMSEQNAALQATAQPCENMEDLAEIQSKLASAQAMRAPHEKARTSLQQQCDAARQEILSATITITRLRHQCADMSKPFLVQLRDTPDQLLRTLANNCDQRISIFDSTHDEQSLLEFSVIEELRRDIVVLRAQAVPAPVLALVPSAPLEGQPHPSLLAVEPPAYAASADVSGSSVETDGLPYHPARAKYYQLVGLIHSKVIRLTRGETHSNDLLEILCELVRAIPLDTDEMCADYAQLNRPLLSSTEAMQLLVERYNAAVSQFQRAIDSARSDVKAWKDFSKAASALLEQVEANRSHLEFNTLFYTRYLRAAHELFEHPTSVPKRGLFQHYADRDRLSSANNCVRGGGIAGIFLGGVLFVTTYLTERFGYREQYELPPQAAYVGYGLAGTSMVAGVCGLFCGQAGGSARAGQQFFANARTISPHYGVVQASGDESSKPLLSEQQVEAGLASTSTGPDNNPSSASTRFSL